jgi:hypothetical protein
MNENMRKKKADIDKKETQQNASERDFIRPKKTFSRRPSSGFWCFDEISLRTCKNDLASTCKISRRGLIIRLLHFKPPQLTTKFIQEWILKWTLGKIFPGVRNNFFFFYVNHRQKKTLKLYGNFSALFFCCCSFSNRMQSIPKRRKKINGSQKKNESKVLFERPSRLHWQRIRRQKIDIVI